LKNNGPGKFSALILVECDLDCSGGGRIIKQQVVLCECGKAHTQKVIILMAHIWKRERAGGVSLLYPGSCTNWTQSNTREIYTRRAKVLLLLVLGIVPACVTSHPRFFMSSFSHFIRKARALCAAIGIYMERQAGRRPERKFFAIVSLCSCEKRCIGDWVCVSILARDRSEREGASSKYKAVNFNASV
jgi:hypothetical protein